MNYKYLDHGGDVGIRARGESFDELLVGAAKGLFDLMADLDEVTSRQEGQLEVNARTEANLLYEWLQELLSLSSMEGRIYKDFDVQIERTDGGFLLRGAMRGEDIDPSWRSLGTEVKGITYQGLEVENHGPNEWSCVFVVDV